jgi:phosphatidate cytidylyltransferase
VALSGGGPTARQAPRTRFGADLKPRVAAAAVMGALALATAWIGGIIFAVFWWLASLVVLWEWQRLIGGARLAERVTLGALFIGLAALFALHNSILGTIAGVVVGAVVVGWRAGPRDGTWAAAGVFYAGALVSSIVLLRLSPGYGLAAVFWVFAVVWGADIAAYFAGRAIGGARLWPSVSPGKTWSGAIVGALAGAVLGLLLTGWTNRLMSLFWLGLATAIVSQLGDLFESALKRRFGVKDSSGLIPGHGGLMDRLDGFVAASVFAAVVAGLNSRSAFIAAGLFQW